MKKYILLLLLMIIPSVCYADGISVSSRNITMDKGTTKNITVSANKAFAIVNPSVNNGNISINKGKFYVDGLEGSASETITITAKSVGSSVITLALDGGTIDEVPITAPITINVTVKEPATQPVTEAPQVVTNTPQTTKKTTTTTASNNTPEETTEAPTTATPTINITKFKIVGYNLDFDPDKYEYDLTLNGDVDELYIIVEGEGITTNNTGVVSIKDLNKIDIKVSKDGYDKTYTINLLKVKGVEEIINKTSNKGYIIAIIALGIVTLLVSGISLYYFVLRRNQS